MQGTRLPQLVLLKHAMHAALVFGVEVQPWRQSDIVICEQQLVMDAQLELQSTPEPPPEPPEPVLVRQPPLWHVADHVQVPALGSLQVPLAVLLATLPLHDTELLWKLMELPLTEPLYTSPVGEQDTVKLHPLCAMVHALSWQLPLSAQLPDTSGQPPPPELLELHANANATHVAPSKPSFTHCMRQILTTIGTHLADCARAG